MIPEHDERVKGCIVSISQDILVNSHKSIVQGHLEAFQGRFSDVMSQRHSIGN
jgi:hypothetical protein